jgi:hypothetical protein
MGHDQAREAGNGKETEEKLRSLSPQLEDRPIDGIGWRHHLVTHVTIEDRRGEDL